ncbi:MAG: M23 family metallopeptidase, partial [Muribaculaceae bacterium]|nr:M23 family metallopeptidase [Muribaculaceae bacterium]
HNGIVTSNFGWRPRFGRMHRGIDLGLHMGDTIRAAFDGKVRLTKFERGGYGFYVIIRHDNGLETVYGHLSRFLVRPDQTVKAGTPIALGGSSGRSTGPHLHFETRFMGMAINPSTIFDFEEKEIVNDRFTFVKSSVERYNLASAYPKAKYKKGKSKSRRLASKSKSKKKSKKRRK